MQTTTQTNRMPHFDYNLANPLSMRFGCVEMDGEIVHKIENLVSKNKKMEMKKIALATLVTLGMQSMNAFAEQEAYNGFSLGYVQSSLNGVSDSTSEFAILRSVRSNERYGYEMQFGLFGNIGPYSSSGFLDLSAIGLVPLGDKGFKLYGKAGVADVYSKGLSENANNLGLTYGAGVEFPRNVGIIRVGFQHLTVGNGTLSPKRSTYVFALTLLLE